MCPSDVNTTVTSDFSELDSAELQEAVSKTTFAHEVTNLEAATTYSIYLKAYSALGGSQQSSTITATTLGGGRFSFYSQSIHPQDKFVHMIRTLFGPDLN